MLIPLMSLFCAIRTIYICVTNILIQFMLFEIDLIFLCLSLITDVFGGN